MARNDGYRRYIEAATVLGQITRARAEELVRDMMGGGEVPRGQAQHWVDDLIDRSRRATEDLFEIVRTEVANQLGALGLDPDEVARQAADLLRRSAEAGRRATREGAGKWGGPGTRQTEWSGAPSGPEVPASRVGHATSAEAKKAAPSARKAGTGAAKTAPAKKAAPSAKKAGTGAAKTAPAKTAPAKTAPAKKAPAKKAPAKKAAKAASGAKKAGTAAVKKAPAKKATATPRARATTARPWAPSRP